MKQTEKPDLIASLPSSALNSSALNSSALNSSRQENGVVVRVLMVVLLSITLIGVTRWALNVTNANARQISTGLTRLQGHYNTQAENESRIRNQQP